MWDWMLVFVIAIWAFAIAVWIPERWWDRYAGFWLNRKVCLPIWNVIKAALRWPISKLVGRRD